MSEIKTINLQGKQYAQVIDRLKHFRSTYPEGRIETDLRIENGLYIVKAYIYIGDKLVSTGHGIKPVKGEFLAEKTETRAIGRALGILGIMADGSISSAEEAMEYFNSKKENNNGR